MPILWVKPDNQIELHYHKWQSTKSELDFKCELEFEFLSLIVYCSSAKCKTKQNKTEKIEGMRRARRAQPVFATLFGGESERKALTTS